MEWKRGQVTRSLAGHDAGSFLAVLEVAPALRGGGRRQAPPPGAAQAEEALPPGAHGNRASRRGLKTNRKLRSALRPFSEAGAK